MSQKNLSTIRKEHRQTGVGDCHTFNQSVLNELMKVLGLGIRAPRDLQGSSLE